MATYSNLPMEITYIILTFLPSESLLRFKSVCKTWRDWINSPEFIKAHLNQSLKTSSNQSILFIKYIIDRYPLFIPLDPSLYQGRHFDHHDSMPAKSITRISSPGYCIARMRRNIIGSCNGLVLLKTDHCLELYNPSTRTSRQISFLGETSCTFFGFGYDSLGDDYKIVGLSTNPHQTIVYSLKENSWRNPFGDGEILGRYSECTQDGVLANNCLHWVQTLSRKQIIVFDLHYEKWGEVPLPNLHGKFMLMQLGFFEGCICLCVGSDHPTVKGLGKSDIWIMREYGVKESWTKLFSYDGYYGMPLAYCKGQSEALFSKLGIQMGKPGHLFRGKIGQGETAKNVMFDDSSLYENIYHSTMCVDSLVPVTYGLPSVQGDVMDTEIEERRKTRKRQISQRTWVFNEFLSCLNQF